MQYLTCPHCNAVYLGDASRSQCPQCQTVVAQPQVAGAVSPPNVEPAAPTKRIRKAPRGRKKSLNTGLLLAGLGLLTVLLMVVGYVAIVLDSGESNRTGANTNQTDSQSQTNGNRLSISRADFRKKVASFPQGPNYKTGQQWHLSGRHWVMSFGPPHENSYKNVDQTMIWRCRDGDIAVICLARPDPLADRNSPKGEKLIVKRIENVN